MAVCTHLDQIEVVTPSGNGCKECLELGDTWVHLRLCMSCGHVGCCDNSKNKHATKHFGSTQHPIIMSYERGEEWGWCYVDHGSFESLPEIMQQMGKDAPPTRERPGRSATKRPVQKGAERSYGEANGGGGMH